MSAAQDQRELADFPEHGRPVDARDILATAGKHYPLAWLSVLAGKVGSRRLSFLAVIRSTVPTRQLPVRQRLQIYLPAFLLALMMQIIAPIGASWAMASALSDPLAAFGGAAICHTAGEKTDSQSDPTSHHVHDGACALCCLVAHAGASPETFKIAVAVPYRSSLAVVWHKVAQDLRDSESGRHANARAPPSNS